MLLIEFRILHNNEQPMDDDLSCNERYAQTIFNIFSTPIIIRTMAFTLQYVGYIFHNKKP